MNPRLRMCLAVSALYGLLFATASQATDITRLPLKMDALVKPNVIFGMDDSGSMDWELLLDTESGVLWWDDAAASAWTGAGRPLTTSDSIQLSYLFPMGTGTGGKQFAYNSSLGYVVPPTPQFASLRSSAYNPIYYNPQQTYRPWSDAYHDSALKTYADATATAAKSHPALTGSITMDLTVTKALSTTAGEYFLLRKGMKAPVGAKLMTASWGGGSWGSALTSEQVMTATTWAAMEYYPATYWQPETCTVDNLACARAPDGQTLKHYEIKSGNTFPVVTSLGRARTYTEEMQNFANWWQYYRKRKLMLAASMGRVLGDVRGVRLGVVAFNNRTDVTMYDSEDSAGAASDRRRVAGYFYTNPADSGTPTATTMNYIGGQFMRTGSAVVQYACQRNNAFIVTDGFANGSPPTPPTYTASTYGSNVWPYQTTTSKSLADIALSYYTNNLRPDLTAGKVPLGDQTRQNPDPNPNLHMNTYGITLGVRGTVWPMATGRTPWSNPFTWPTPVADTQTSIDDLWHATINGRGQMYLATTPEETAANIQAGLDDIRSQTGAQTSLSVSTINLGRGDGKAYLGTYNPSGWGGDITAANLDKSTGAIGTQTWSAASLLGARSWSTRVIASHNGSAGVAFTAAAVGSLVNPGNAYGTTANVVNYLRGDRSGEAGSPSTFRKRTSLIGAVINARPVVDRETGVLYAPSSEGMVHALDTGTGSELWAYAPYAALSGMGASSAPSWSFATLLDGSPIIAKAGSARLLIGGLGSAGAGYYAIDVTSPKGLSESTLAGNVKWEFPGGTTGIKMGASVGKPVLADTRTHGQVVLLAQGYRPDDRTALGSNDGITRVYMLDATTGTLLETFQANAGTGTGDPGLAHLSAMVDADGKVRYVYGGDELGNLWRFDIETTTMADKVVRIAQLKDASGNAQPVTAAPELINIKGSRVVLVGTGRLLALSDFGSTRTQSFYAIKDSGAALTNARSSLVQRLLGSEASGERDLTADGDTNTANDPVYDWSTQRGWFFDLPAGQQANTEPTIALGAIVFTTNTATASSCSAQSYLYVVDVLTGLNLAKASFAAVKLADLMGSASTVLNTDITSGSSGSRSVDGGGGDGGGGEDPCEAAGGNPSRLVSKVTLADGSTIARKLPVCSSVKPRKNAWRQIRRD